MGREYLVITDKYSGWPELFDFGKRGVNSKDVEKAISRWSMAMGIPNHLTSDNGPQFKSEEFKNYWKKWGIHHNPSSPYNHFAKEHAEAVVKLMKGLVEKISLGKMCHMPEFINALMEYHNTERKEWLSPAQRLFGRPTRTRLPTHTLVFDHHIQDKFRKADK